MNIKNKEKISEFSLIIVTIIWGSGFIATEAVIQANWSTSLIMVSRFIIATIMIAIISNKKLLSISKQELLYGLVTGVFLFLGFYTQTLGQTTTNVSNVAFLTSINVIMIPFISWAISKKRPNLQTIFLTILTLVGVGVLSYDGEAFSLGRGDILVLLAAFFFASQIAYLEKATYDTDPIRINFIQILTATILSVVSFIFSGQEIQGANIQKGILPILYLGIFSTCICFFLQTRAQKHVSAAKVGIILSLEGVFGGLFSVILGLEPFTINLLIGGGLIVLASILSNLDLSRNKDYEETAENFT